MTKSRQRIGKDVFLYDVSFSWHCSVIHNYLLYSWFIPNCQSFRLSTSDSFYQLTHYQIFCLAQISSFIPNGILHSNLFALLRFLDQCLIPNHGHSRIPSAMHCPLSSHPQDSFVMAICSFIASTFLNLIALCLDTSDALSLFVHAIVTHLFVPTHSSVHD